MIKESEYQGKNVGFAYIDNNGEQSYFTSKNLLKGNSHANARTIRSSIIDGDDLSFDYVLRNRGSRGLFRFFLNEEGLVKVCEPSTNDSLGAVFVRERPGYIPLEANSNRIRENTPGIHGGAKVVKDGSEVYVIPYSRIERDSDDNAIFDAGNALKFKVEISDITA